MNAMSPRKLSGSNQLSVILAKVMCGRHFASPACCRSRAIGLLGFAIVYLSVASMNAAVIDVKWTAWASDPNATGLFTRTQVEGVATSFTGFASLEGLEPASLTYEALHTVVLEQIGAPGESTTGYVKYGGSDVEPAVFAFSLDGTLVANSTDPTFTLETDFTRPGFPSVRRAVIPVSGIAGTEFYQEVMDLTGGTGILQFVSNTSTGASSTGRFDGTGKIVAELAMEGDFNADRQLDVADIDRLAEVIRLGRRISTFDIDESGHIDSDDLTHFVHHYLKTWYGDANLDGTFNSTDMVDVFLVGEYEDEVALNSTWAEGDWNGSGDFDSGDFVTAFLDGGYEVGPRPSVASVPEPSGMILIGISSIALLGFARRRRENL